MEERARRRRGGREASTRAAAEAWDRRLALCRYFSYVYCGGHLALSLSQAPHAPSAGASAAAAAAAAAPSSPQMPFLFGLGLLLIAVGAGGVDRAISAVLSQTLPCTVSEPSLQA